MSRVTITYKASITTDVDLTKVGSYLESKGWKKGYRYGSFGYIFTHADKATIILPSKYTIADFGLRMSELFQELANFEGRQVPDVLKDIQGM